MIRRLKYHEIDFEKYDRCVLHSKECRIYAESWYLDAVSGKKWDCFVLGDYEAVMPLPYQKKLGIKRIVQPVFCQQLGVFSQVKIHPETFIEFKKKLQKKWVKVYQFNEDNYVHFHPKGQEKINHVLKIRPYKELYENLQRDRKKDIRRIEKLNLSISEDFNFDMFKKELLIHYPYFKKIYDTPSFDRLIMQLFSRKRILYLKLMDENKIISQILVATGSKRKVLLFSNRDSSKKYKGAFAFLLNHYIKNYLEEGDILDFEGSMNPGIAKFNESFGAQRKVYVKYSNFVSRIFFLKMNFI